MTATSDPRVGDTVVASNMRSPFRGRRGHITRIEEQRALVEFERPVPTAAQWIDLADLTPGDQLAVPADWRPVRPPQQRGSVNAFWF